jgi:hypothetical protein
MRPVIPSARLKERRSEVSGAVVGVRGVHVRGRGARQLPRQGSLHRRVRVCIGRRGGGGVRARIHLPLGDCLQGRVS